MLGLAPGIHAHPQAQTLRVSWQRRGVRTIASQSPWDGQDKPGHDSLWL
jgi:hypothetical protein